jgi:hypothetical protein
MNQCNGSCRFKPSTPTLKGPKLCAEVRALIGKPPILSSEDPDAYETMLVNMAAAAMPRDAIEWLLIVDCVNLTWEIRRIRLARSGITDVTRKEALKSILESTLDHNELQGQDRIVAAELKAEDWYNGPSAKEKLLAHLAKHGLDEDAITAQAYALRTRELEKLDQMLASAEKRRFAMLQEIGVYRDLFALRMNEVIGAIDEGIDELTLQPRHPRASEPERLGAPTEHEP